MENENQWKYPELPPFALFEELKLNPLYADEGKVARASWFWLRRPKPLFTKSLLDSLVCVSAAPFLVFVPTVGLPLFLTWSLGILIAAIADEVWLIRWRCEYELSIDRMIGTLRKAI
jgi:hypothetical protein